MGLLAVASRPFRVGAVEGASADGAGIKQERQKTMKTKEDAKSVKVCFSKLCKIDFADVRLAKEVANCWQEVAAAQRAYMSAEEERNKAWLAVVETSGKPAAIDKLGAAISDADGRLDRAQSVFGAALKNELKKRGFDETAGDYRVYASLVSGEVPSTRFDVYKAFGKGWENVTDEELAKIEVPTFDVVPTYAGRVREDPAFIAMATLDEAENALAASKAAFDDARVRLVAAAKRFDAALDMESISIRKATGTAADSAGMGKVERDALPIQEL